MSPLATLGVRTPTSPRKHWGFVIVATGDIGRGDIGFGDIVTERANNRPHRRPERKRVTRDNYSFADNRPTSATDVAATRAGAGGHCTTTPAPAASAPTAGTKSCPSVH
jgi:hypothetical protein